MTEPKLLVVVVCYHAVDLTVDCLRSLAAQIEEVPGTRVAVCENGSGELALMQLLAAIEKNGWRPWVTVTSISENRGFAGGNNVILREALEAEPSFHYFLLLNSDTIVRPGALKLLVEAAQENRAAGIIGSRLEWPDATPQVSAFLDFTPIHEFIYAAASGPVTKLFRRRHGSLPVMEVPHEAQWISFACVLIRREVFEDCGLLDEGYYLYFDDADFCRSARNRKWKVLYYPAARVVHLRGRSNPVKSLTARRLRRPRYWYLSRNRYYAKFYGRSRLWMANLLWMVGRMISLVRELLCKKERSVCESEWRDIWTNSWTPLRKPLPSDHQER